MCHSRFIALGSIAALSARPVSSHESGAWWHAQVLEVHEAFLDRLSRGWLLTRSNQLIRAMEGLQAPVHAFCDLIDHMEVAVQDGNLAANGNQTPTPGAPNVQNATECIMHVMLPWGVGGAQLLRDCCMSPEGIAVGWGNGIPPPR